MKLFGLLQKPDWDHKDAARRLRAVQSSQDPVLLGKLAELAQADPDPRVRAAALRRVDDPVLLERRLRGENDAEVAAVARKRLIERLCSPAVPADAASAVLLQVHDPEVLQQIAEESPLPALRRIALERCARPGLWVQRCIHDPDPALRLWLLERIDAPEALQRIADASRKRDKRLTRAARDKLEAQQLAADDGPALQRRVLALCEQVARLGRELPGDREPRMAAHRQEWIDVRERVDADLQRRADGTFDMAEAALAAARGEPIVRVTAEPAPTSEPVEAIPLAEPEPQPDPVIDRLLDELPSVDAEDFQARIEAIHRAAEAFSPPANMHVREQLARLDAALAARQKAHREAASQARRKHFESQLDALDAALHSGSPAAARAARDALEPGLSRDLQRRLADADERLAKLERWQRWSGSKVRSRLCDEAEALHGSGLHPDAVANRIKELQAEWARLDALEGSAAPGPEHGLTKRFRALCHRAIAPARPYFEKRRELRSERSGQIAALLAEAETLPNGLEALQALRKRLRDALPELDGVDPGKRGQQGRLLRERLAAVDHALGELREQAALGKRRLIAHLRRDLGAVDPVGAVDLAKRAQADWKRMPRSERTIEDELWTELRGLIDPLFERVKAQEVESRARSAEAEAAAQAILSELEELATAGSERLLHASAHLDSLQSRWRALTPREEPPRSDSGRGERGGRDGAARRGPPARAASRDRPRPGPRVTHPLESRFEAAAGRVREARRGALLDRDREELERICEAGALLDRIAASESTQREALHAQFDALSLPADARDALAGRSAALAEGGSEASTESDLAEVLAVRAELEAGIDSPASAAGLRRQEQMKRLAAKLSGQAGSDPRRLLRGLQIELQALPGLPTDQRSALQARILVAWEQVARQAGEDG